MYLELFEFELVYGHEVKNTIPGTAKPQALKMGMVPSGQTVLTAQLCLRRDPQAFWGRQMQSHIWIEPSNIGSGVSCPLLFPST